MHITELLFDDYNKDISPLHLHKLDGKNIYAQLIELIQTNKTSQLNIQKLIEQNKLLTALVEKLTNALDNNRSPLQKQSSTNQIKMFKQGGLKNHYLGKNHG